MDKKSSRIRRAMRSRKKILELKVARLMIHRTPRHMYAQIIASTGSEVIASASTVEKSVRNQVTNNTGNISVAKIVGKIVAERALKKGVSTVAFDRSGFRYHGRVAALAQSAREAGLKF
ncbi:50S ribosomal protein L18 [Candidatus Photodesmus katoptron]|uniref:Large ribosomal subunit protein uL18 n=1 Tax=Candidatus Photodesmus katoptron Akat1 TaxID=1236703 RepID=S3DJB0_9GAMM|nr:50S ribosomal protein L18 [Candidatus Photodesmus katoptron]EPE37229.1 ribosomal protein L18 [Candidatus Photodesmus katoptron Akat1]KEY90116.1 50S ribosomal protein L18 [Candidatus Photodesmus katoptron]